MCLKMSERKSKILLVVCLIVGAMLLHYGTPHRLMYLHILLQALFFVPVSLSGWWFGKKGGLSAASAVAAVYLYHAVTVMMPTPEMAVSNGIQILLLFVVGFLVGVYADIRAGYQKAMSASEPYRAAFPAGQKLLVHVDDSGASMHAVSHVAHTFKGVPDVKITLLSVVAAPNPDLSESEQELEEKQSGAVKRSRNVVEKARSLLMESGFEEARIETRYSMARNSRPSDVILREQQAGNHSTIVVGRHRLTRAEEFLFGSPAIRLARQAPCPVWVVAESDREPPPAEHEKRPD